MIGIVIQIFKFIPSVVITSPLKSLGMKEQWEQYEQEEGQQEARARGGLSGENVEAFVGTRLEEE